LNINALLAVALALLPGAFINTKPSQGDYELDDDLINRPLQLQSTYG